MRAKHFSGTGESANDQLRATIRWWNRYQRVIVRKLGVAIETALIVAIVGTQTAEARTGAAITITSQDRFRGRPVSKELPTVGADLLYSAASGVYVGVGGTVVASRQATVDVLSGQIYGGYAFSLTPGITADAGIIDRFYTNAFSGGFDANFVELTAGITARNVAARVAVSPNYYNTGRKTAYFDLTAAAPITPRLTLQGRGGVLVPLTNSSRPRFVRGQYDASVSVIRRIGRASAQLSWAFAGPADDVFNGSRRGKGAFILAIAYGI